MGLDPLGNQAMARTRTCTCRFTGRLYPSMWLPGDWEGDFTWGVGMPDLCVHMPMLACCVGCCAFACVSTAQCAVLPPLQQQQCSLATDTAIAATSAAPPPPPPLVPLAVLVPLPSHWFVTFVNPADPGMGIAFETWQVWASQCSRSGRFGFQSV